MASIAPISSAGSRHQVSPLLRAGGLLLVLLVTAAGIAPIIPWGGQETTIETGNQVEAQAVSAPEASGSGLIVLPPPEAGADESAAAPAAEAATADGEAAALDSEPAP